MTPEEQRQMRHYELNAIEQDRQIVELSNENERLKIEVYQLGHQLSNADGNWQAKLKGEQDMAGRAYWQLQDLLKKVEVGRDAIKAENERLKRGLHAQERLLEFSNDIFRGASQPIMDLWPESERPPGIQMICDKLAEVRAERDNLRSLLVQAVGLLSRFDKSLHEDFRDSQVVQIYDEDQDSYPSIGITVGEIRAASAFLALPQIAEMKEMKA